MEKRGFWSTKPFSTMKVDAKEGLICTHSDITVMATVCHKSGVRHTEKFIITRATRGVNKHEIAVELKEALNQAGVLDKVVQVIVK